MTDIVENAQSLIDYANESLSTSYTNLTDIITHELDVPEQPAVEHIPTAPLGQRIKSLIDYANDICESKHSNLNDIVTKELKGQRSYSVEEKEPYLFRKSGGSASIGTRMHDKIVGGTVAWNQLVPVESATSTSNGVTFTKSTDGTVTASGTAEGTAELAYQNNNVQKDHIVIITGCPTGGSLSTYCIVDNAQSRNKYDYGDGKVYKVDSSANYISIRIRVFTGTTVNNLVFKPQLFDLTQMFGTAVADQIYAMEQATAGSGVAFFRSLFPKPYYAYDAGSLVSVAGLKSHDTVGFNLWDEQWEVGGYNPSTGEKASYTNRIRCKYPISVVPNSSYYFLRPAMGNDAYNVVCWYDASGNYISGASTRAFEITAPSNARYMAFNVASQYGTTYNNDICINLSSDRNGQYEPYKVNSYKIAELSFNKWDEEWEDGIVNSDGSIGTSTTRIVSKNFIPVVEGQTYCYSMPVITNGIGRGAFYDADKNFVSYMSNFPESYQNVGGRYVGTVTVPARARYLKFGPSAQYGTTYNNDICINLSDPAKNGTYEPYVDTEPLTLRGVPKLVDNQLQFDGDEYASDGTVTRKYGIVDLGGQAWSTNQTGENTYEGFTTVTGKKYGIKNFICSSFEYKQYSDDGQYGIRGYASSSGVVVRVPISVASTPADLKTLLNGVYLVYELAEPTTETAQPYAIPQIVHSEGTEEYICETDADVIIPVGHDTMYSTE